MFKIGDQIRLIDNPVDGIFTLGRVYAVGGRWSTDTNPDYVGILRNDDGREDQWYSKNFELAGGPW